MTRQVVWGPTPGRVPIMGALEPDNRTVPVHGSQ
jgi:hypothetical protein